MIIDRATISSIRSSLHILQTAAVSGWVGNIIDYYGCLGYHRPNITNKCPSKRSWKFIFPELQYGELRSVWDPKTHQCIKHLKFKMNAIYSREVYHFSSKHWTKREQKSGKISGAVFVWPWIIPVFLLSMVRHLAQLILSKSLTSGAPEQGWVIFCVVPP